MPLLMPHSLQQMQNIHREELEAHFGPLGRQAHAIRPDIRLLFVGFTNRCGSNYVCEALASGGRLNLGEEFYNAGTILANCRDRGLDSVGAFTAMLIEERSMNGWLVAKLAVEHLAILTEIGLLDQILDRSHFMLVQRADRLAQAISLAIAVQNDRWSDAQPARIPDTALVYDGPAIASIMEGLTNANGLFDRFFGLNGLVPHIVTYEQFVRMPEAVLGDIAAVLGITEFAVMPRAVRMRPQGGAVNAEWRARFLAQR